MLRLALMEMVLQGVTTRKVEKVTEALCGTDFSPSLVSELCKTLGQELTAFRDRPLEGAYPYLVIDARYEKVRIGGQVVTQAALIIVGINDQGYREGSGIEVANLESESTWGEVFRRLQVRGLRGVRRIVSDNHPGIKEAVCRYFCGCVWQRCRVHCIRNLCGFVAKKERKELVKRVHRI